MTADDRLRMDEPERTPEGWRGSLEYRTDLLALCEKARAMGLDERQIDLACQRIGLNPEQQQDSWEAYMRVAIHALAFDNPGVPVAIDRYGIGLVPHADGSMTLWRRW